jgi:transcriptional regulator with XRE-family HTH domain
MESKQLYQAIGALIREHRKRHGLTQERLAKQIGMSRAAIANIEAGRQQLLVHQLYDIASVFELDISILIPIRSPTPIDQQFDQIRLPDDLTSTQREQILNHIHSADTKS